MKKVVLKLDLQDNKGKQKAMKAVCYISGIDSIAVDMNDNKMTLTGDIDPVKVVDKLRKLCHTEIVTVGPVQEPEKKKEEPKKEEEKKKDPNEQIDIAELLKAYEAYNRHWTPHYHVVNIEENPNVCVIC